ncbi:hypothetical protein IMZ48_24050 [Candidatus Bathyarchaeota archaeon]|nr:hypothetical protein [Candidatus Bathyarchaeota archaeon]
MGADDLQSAIADVASGTSANAAATSRGIPYSTLYRNCADILVVSTERLRVNMILLDMLDYKAPARTRLEIQGRAAIRSQCTSNHRETLGSVVNESQDIRSCAGVELRMQHLP